VAQERGGRKEGIRDAHPTNLPRHRRKGMGSCPSSSTKGKRGKGGGGGGGSRTHFQSSASTSFVYANQRVGGEKGERGKEVNDSLQFGSPSLISGFTWCKEGEKKKGKEKEDLPPASSIYSSFRGTACRPTPCPNTAGVRKGKRRGGKKGGGKGGTVKPGVGSAISAIIFEDARMERGKRERRGKKKECGSQSIILGTVSLF